MGTETENISTRLPWPPSQLNEMGPRVHEWEYRQINPTNNLTREPEGPLYHRSNKECCEVEVQELHLDIHHVPL